MRTNYLWMLAIVILSSTVFWFHSRSPAALVGSKPEPTRVVFQLVRGPNVRLEQAYHEACVTLVRRLSHGSNPSPEIQGTLEEVSVTVPKSMKASELVELATAQPNLRIQTPQGWGPPQLNLTRSASVDQDVDDNWELILYFDKPEARRLASLISGPTVVGLFLNDRLVARQEIGPKFTRTCELEFTGLGRPESGTRRQEGSGYDPPIALKRVQACLDVPLPTQVRIVKLREE